MSIEILENGSRTVVCWQLHVIHVSFTDHLISSHLSPAIYPIFCCCQTSGTSNLPDLSLLPDVCHQRITRLFAAARRLAAATHFFFYLNTLPENILRCRNQKCRCRLTTLLMSQTSIKGNNSVKNLRKNIRYLAQPRSYQYPCKYKIYSHSINLFSVYLVKGHNSVTNLRKMKGNNYNLDLVNINNVQNLVTFYH